MSAQLDFGSAPAAESDREINLGHVLLRPPDHDLDLFNSVVTSSTTPSTASSTSTNVGTTDINHAPLPHLLDEIARIWSLPLGERAEITFRPAFPLPAISGLLELRTDPAYPWDARRPLALRIAGCDFTSRDIERWNLV